MIRSLIFTGILVIFLAVPAFAQERQHAAREMEPGLRRRALVIEINAKVLDDAQTVIWTESHRKVTIPGSPVGIKLVGSNLVVAVQFTPFIRRQGNVLVAQGQIWIETQGGGVSYYTSIQTIPMDFDEPIYFFPLGASKQLGSSIEIMLTVNPYRETAVTENE
jgi:hypothetical protein